LVLSLTLAFLQLNDDGIYGIPVRVVSDIFDRHTSTFIL
jgi:hypothetical protein